MTTERSNPLSTDTGLIPYLGADEATISPRGDGAVNASLIKFVIKCVGLAKVFRDFWGRHRVQAVGGVDLSVYRGEVFGLLGPNGSGKTTTIKMLLGLLHPTAGRVSIFGKRPDDVAVKKLIGYLPEGSYLYGFLNARETLDHYGRLFGLSSRQRRQRIDMLLEMVGLEAVQHRPVGEFSTGMQRRIGLAQALINDPQLLILDEPTAGLDPIGTRQIKDLILDMARRGKTVLLCSHLLADVEDVCDRVAVMFGGKVRALGRVHDLLVQQDMTTIHTAALDEPSIEKVESLLESMGKHIDRVEHPRQKLENLFLEVVQKAQAEGITSGGTASHRMILPFLTPDPPPPTAPPPIDHDSRQPAPSPPLDEEPDALISKLIDANAQRLDRDLEVNTASEVDRCEQTDQLPAIQDEPRPAAPPSAATASPDDTTVYPIDAQATPPTPTASKEPQVPNMPASNESDPALGDAEVDASVIDGLVSHDPEEFGIDPIDQDDELDEVDGQIIQHPNDETEAPIQPSEVTSPEEPPSPQPAASPITVDVDAAPTPVTGDPSIQPPRPQEYDPLPAPSNEDVIKVDHPQGQEEIAVEDTDAGDASSPWLTDQPATEQPFSYFSEALTEVPPYVEEQDDEQPGSSVEPTNQAKASTKTQSTGEISAPSASSEVGSLPLEMELPPEPGSTSSSLDRSRPSRNRSEDQAEHTGRKDAPNRRSRDQTGGGSNT